MAWEPLVIFVFSATAFMAVVRFPLIWLDRWPRLWLRLACLAALLPWVPIIGIEFNGAHRWLALPGGLHMSSYYLVLTFFMAGAAALSAHSPGNKAHKAEIIALTGITLFALLAQPHFWAACAFLGMVLMALTIHGRWKQALILGAIPLTAVIVTMLSHPYQRMRMLNFMHPESDPLWRGYQLLNNLYTIATTQWFGPSTTALLPHKANIYGDLAMIACHYGLAAASLVIVLLGGIVAIGVWRAARQTEPRLRTLGLLMSLGLGCWAWFAAAWPLGLVPTIGVPLPFVGGFFASIFAALALGFIYRASQSASIAPAPTRSACILMAIIFVCVGLLLAKMWTLKPPLTNPVQQRGQIFDAQGIALTETHREGRRYSLHYPHGKTLAQVLGLTNVDGDGIAGLQLQYDRALSGMDGEPSRNLHLSIDLRNQLALEATLLPYLERYGDTIEALVMKPDGTILASASLPSYDPNQRREMSQSLMRFRPATDTAQAGPMMRPFYLAHSMETQGEQFLTSSPTAPDVADILKTQGLRAALVRFGFDKSTGLDFPGAVSSLIYSSQLSDKPLPRWYEKELRTELSEGWGVAPSLIRYAVSFTGLVTGSLPQPRLVTDPQKTSTSLSPVIKLETAAAMRANMEDAARRAGHENLGGIWSTYRPKPYPSSDQELRYATAALFEPADKPQHLVFVKLVSKKREPLPKDLGLEIGAKLLDAEK